MNDSTALVPLQETMQLGEVLARSGFFEDSRQAAQAVVKILAGREIGIGPIAAMTGIYIVKGKPSIGANVMAGAVKRSGRYNYRIKQHDGQVCAIEFFERNGDKWETIGVSTFTLEDAKRAGTQNLDRFARNMLFARAMSNGVRWYCPDIFGGAPVYTPEEMGMPVDGDGDVIEGTYKPVEVHTAIPEVKADATATVAAPAPKPANGNGSNGDKPRLAVIRTPLFPQYAQRFVEHHPQYAGKNGAVDGPHIQATAAQKLEPPYFDFTNENIAAVFAALEAYATEQEQAPA